MLIQYEDYGNFIHDIILCVCFNKVNPLLIRTFVLNTVTYNPGNKLMAKRRIPLFETT